MGPYRKPFLGDPLFPFELVHKAQPGSKTELPDHLHDLFEMVYVHQGVGTFFIDGSFYDMTPGSLFIIPGNTLHRSFSDKACPIQSTAVFFAPSLVQGDSLISSYSSLWCFDSARAGKNYKMELPPHIKEEAEKTLEQMHGEMSTQRFGYREAVRLFMQQLLLLLNRYIGSNLQEKAPIHRVGPEWFKKALTVIDHHLHENLQLTALAKEASVSPPHFSRVFKQLTGMNVTDYVNTKRIIRAKELLRESDESIDLIAERCGFDSLPYFYRVFKALSGTSPGSYRKKQGKSP